jgi:predicted porin
MIGLGANYNLSKNTSYYVRVEKISGLNGGSSTATLASQGIAPVVSYGNATSTKSMVGIRMAF